MKTIRLLHVLFVALLAACGDTSTKGKYEVHVLEGSPQKLTVTFNENGSINQGEVEAPWSYEFDTEPGKLASVSVVVSNGVGNTTPFRVSVAAYRNGDELDSAETVGTSFGTARVSEKF